jgi:hypothetical protein
VSSVPIIAVELSDVHNSEPYIPAGLVFVLV